MIVVRYQVTASNQLSLAILNQRIRQQFTRYQPDINQVACCLRWCAEETLFAFGASVLGTTTGPMAHSGRLVGGCRLLLVVVGCFGVVQVVVVVVVVEVVVVVSGCGSSHCDFRGLP